MAKLKQESKSGIFINNLYYHCCLFIPISAKAKKFVKSKDYAANYATINKQKGNDYERQIGRFYQQQGYKVYFKGIKEGRRDQGIDLIAYKGREAILIQCKNWENNR